MTGWFVQLQYFCGIFLTGILLGLFLHFYWLLIRCIAPRRSVLTLTDLFFSVFLLLLLAGGLFFINAGEIRMYVWLALLLGGILYKQCLYARLHPFFLEVLEEMKKGAGRILRVVRYLHSQLKNLLNKIHTPAAESTEEK